MQEAVKLISKLRLHIVHYFYFYSFCDRVNIREICRMLGLFVLAHLKFIQ